MTCNARHRACAPLILTLTVPCLPCCAQGVIFNLSDRYLTSGALGCMAVGLTPASTYGVMQRVLSFISAMDVDVAQRADWSLTTEATTFQDVQGLVKYMAEQSSMQEREARLGHGGGGGVGAGR